MVMILFGKETCTDETVYRRIADRDRRHRRADLVGIRTVATTGHQHGDGAAGLGSGIRRAGATRNMEHDAEAGGLHG